MKNYTYKLVRSLFLLLGYLWLMPTATAQLKADFTADTTQGCSPLVVKFTDLSKGNPTSWYWDLGNGTFSTLKNPTTFYFDTGRHTIKFVVQNATGKDSVVKTGYINVFASPAVNFTATPTSGCFPLKVRFTDASTAGSGTIKSWQWDFGDGTGSNLQNPEHTYTVAGSFTVSLRVVNSNGCVTFFSKANHIKIQSGVIANFGFLSQQTCKPPTEIKFTDSSVGNNINSYKWDFGDGTTSSQKSPSHTYNNAGSYSIKLVVGNSYGCKDSMIKTNAVVVGSVKADFLAPDTACLASPVSFVNQSSPAPVAVTWDFGDASMSNVNDPIKSYASPGNYTVKLVADFGACKDTVSKTVYVRQKPRANFSLTSTGVSCTPPLTVNFSNNSVGAVAYHWNFGDGSNSTVAMASHTYISYGSFNVSLVAIDNKGCTDTAIQQDAVYIGPPHITGIVGIPFRGCVPYSTTFQPLINASEQVSSYFWDFGDGTTSTAANPSHNYTKQGSYNVSLYITTRSGCKDSFIVQQAVIISTKPTAAFSASPTETCAYQPVNFTDESTGQVTSYSWFFGDLGTSSNKNPIYFYKDTGYFSVTLVAKNDYCTDTIVKPRYIHISPPIADFSKSYSCDSPYLRHFTDKSIGANSWKWDFGDGSGSTLPNPSHSYSSPGIYYVSLEVSNGTCLHITYDTLTIIDEKPDFTISDTSRCKYSTAVFTATNVNTANIRNYYWNFGDGSTTYSFTPNTSYAYQNAGNYSPSLVTTDILGCTDTVTHQTAKRVYGPKAMFTSPEGTCRNGIIVFANQSVADSIYPIKQFMWDYGDGSRDTLATGPYQHQYNTVGTFTVKLSLVDTNGCTDSLVKPNAVLITKPVAGFSSDTVKCSGNGVLFTNLSQGVDLKFNWDFGDNNKSQAVHPLHAYSQPGVYNVKLFVSDKFNCTDSVFVPRAVRIADPLAHFSVQDSIGNCPPFFITLSNTSTNYSSIKWDFGDGSVSNIDNASHFYYFPGTYQLKLVANGFGSCADSVSKTIIVKGPTGSIDYDTAGICSPDTIRFRAYAHNNSSFLWDFSDGTTLATFDSAVSHVYKSPGIYRPRLLLIDAGGCRVPITGAVDIVAGGIKAAIAKVKATYCDSALVYFHDSSSVKNDVITSYKWDFGDNNYSSAANPSNYYKAAGNYTVRLMIASQKGCADTAVIPSAIKIVSSPQINILADTSACQNQSVSFNATVANPDTSFLVWNWNFGNGGTSKQPSPSSQKYSTVGKYAVTLVATNSTGCSDTSVQVINIHPTPNINAGPDTAVCQGQSIVLKASGGSAYTWNADPSLSCTNCASSTARPQNDKSYFVIGTNDFGCSSGDSVKISVIHPFNISVSAADTICLGETTTLSAKGADHYIWSPSAGLNSSVISNPVAHPSQTTTYTVVGSDRMACFEDSAKVDVTVYPVPAFDIVQDNVVISVGTNVALNTTNSADITGWRWLPFTGLSCTNCANPIASPKSTTTYKATAFNRGGCTAEDEVTIQVICNKGNVFIPNTFSPNGDGVNDVFYPRGSGIGGIRSMTIFNRWGQVVYQRMNFTANDMSAGWDGTYKGVKLPNDVFVYSIDVICENSEVFTLKGDVSLLR